MEGTYIIGAIFFVFIVVDIFLIIFLVAWIRSEIAMRNYHMKKDMIRQRSIECLDAEVRLQLKRKPSSPDSESSNEETCFNEGNQVNSEDQNNQGEGAVPNDCVEVFLENQTNDVSDKSFEERKLEAQLNRPNTRTESETPLLLDVNVEETLKLAQILSVVPETNSLPRGGEKLPPQYQRLQSSDFRRDNKAPLLENEINIEGGSPPQSPVKHLPIEEEEEIHGDIKLVSLASMTTGPIIPTDSPPHSIPNEIKSLDVSAVSGTVGDSQTTETSFSVPNDPLHSTSGTSIGWSDVFELIQGTNAEVEDTVKQHGGQLAPETFIALSSDNYSNASNVSLSSINNNGSVNRSMTQPDPVSASCPNSNHERAFSYDTSERHSSFDRSFPPYLTPQHVLPRPRGRSNPGQGSLSLTPSPAHKRKL